VETADFALIGNAAAVQTALRTITGWEAVTVTTDVSDFTMSHAFTVTFPAGYDDGGQVPITGAYESSVYTRGGAKANSATVSVVDQRFSNSLWMGEISGWHEFVVTNPSGFVMTGVNNKPTAEAGDVFEFSSVHYGFGTTSATSDTATSAMGTCVTKSSNAGIECITGTYTTSKVYGRIKYSANRPTQTSQQTEDYFAVGANVEVMDLTWADDALGTNVDTNIKNIYRKFRVLSHVTNGHGKMFAKLDSTPETDSSTDYTLRVTSNNGTTSSFNQVRIVASQNEVQTIKVIDSSNQLGHTATETYRLYINKGKSNEEFTEVLTYGSSNAQVAEAINAFSALSGPVKVDNVLHGFNTNVATTTHAKVITFDAIDGDVPQLHAESVGSLTGTLHTTTIRDGSSLTGGADARFEHMEAGGMINITSQETVTFTLPSADTTTVIAFSYDNVMQSGAAAALDGTTDDADIETALASIQDDNLVKIIGATTDFVAEWSSPTLTVTLPKGLSGAKLEAHVLAGINTKTTKTVNRNNNGKSFTIVRAAHTKSDLTNLGVFNTAHALMSNELVDLRVGDVLDVTGCSAGTNAPNAGVTPYTVPITAFTGTVQGVVKIIAAFGGSDGAGCAYSQVRDTLVLDAIPDAMTGLVDVTYTAPRGSCAVTEVSKGTTESATCSHRGVCDGGSGLCECHEGYSGEACETQTVLV